MTKANKRRMYWMAEFERLVTAAMPNESGRIDWNSPTYHFTTGASAREAADKYIAWRTREEAQ